MRGLGAAWQRFWFEPEETSTLAIVRIAFGLVALAWTLTLTPDGEDFFSDSGVLAGTTYEGEPAAAWGVLDLFDSGFAVSLLLALLLLACACLVVGQYTRLAALAVLVGILSLERRNPFVFNSGDGLLKVIAFYMVLAPSGASFSLDRWRRARERFWEFPKRAAWPLRLMQVQLSILYLSSVWAKLPGNTWNDGTAVSYALRLEDLQRFEPPHFVLTSELVSNLMSYATLAIEASLGVLIWNRTLRPYVLALGVALHLGIDLSLRVGFFSFAAFVLYLAFIPPRKASAWLLVLKERMNALREKRARAEEEVDRDRVLRSAAIRGQLDR